MFPKYAESGAGRNSRHKSEYQRAIGNENSITETDTAANSDRQARINQYKRQDKELPKLAKKIDEKWDEYKEPIENLANKFANYENTSYGTMLAMGLSRDNTKDELVKAIKSLPKDVLDFISLKDDEMTELYRGAKSKEDIGNDGFLSFSSSKDVAGMFGSNVTSLKSDVSKYGRVVSVERLEALRKSVEAYAEYRWQESVLGTTPDGRLKDGVLPSRPIDSYRWFTKVQNREGEHLVFGVKWK
jgi:hypothetical protein